MVKEKNDKKKKIFVVTLQNVYTLVYKNFAFCPVQNNFDSSYAIIFYILEKKLKGNKIYA